MKKLVTLVILAVLALGVLIFGVGHPTTSVAHIGVLEDEAVRNLPDPGNASATAGITITMYTEPDE